MLQFTQLSSYIYIYFFSLASRSPLMRHALISVNTDTSSDRRWRRCPCGPRSPPTLNAACALRMQRGSTRVQQDAAMPFELEHIKSCAKTQVRKHFPCPAASPTFLPNGSDGSELRQTSRSFSKNGTISSRTAADLLGREQLGSN